MAIEIGSLRALFILILALAMVVSAVIIYGRENTWALFAGPADQGAVDFTALKRSGTSNSFLMCPAGFCKKSDPDAEPPIFALSVERLSRAARAAWLSGDMVEQVAQSDDGLRLRYVQRSRWLRFPDTISIEFIPLGDGQSTLAIYSRSQIGYSDLGANESRIKAWMDRLQDLPRVQ